MVALSPHIATHRDLHTLRASLCEQYGKMYRAYTVTHHHYFKGICKGLHQAVKEIDALLDGPFDRAAEDRLDHIENTARLHGRNPGEDAGQDRDGRDTLPARKAGAWGTAIKGAIVLGALLAFCLLMKGVER